MGTPAQQMVSTGARAPEVLDEDDAIELHSSAAVGGLDAITRGEVDVQIATARRFPRSLKAAREDAETLATVDEETAQSCFYVLERSGKEIEGPSVRLAEIFASAWGNLRFGSRVVGDDGRFITAQGFCHDLQKNNFVAIEVQRRVTNSRGKRYSDDMIAVTANAAQSIALRNAIFRIIPRAYVNAVFHKAKEVAIGNAETLVSKRGRVLERLAKMGVKEDRILARLGKAGTEEIGLPELSKLIGMGTAIKDGQATVDETFPAIATAEKPGEAAPAANTKASAAAEQVQRIADEAKKKAGEKKPDDEKPKTEEAAK